MSPDQPESIGKYTVEGVIDRRAKGAVYKAVDPATNRVVAVKVLPEDSSRDAESLEQFTNRVDEVAKLNHPNIVQIVERSQDADGAWFAMEFVEGESLAEVMRRRKLSLPEVLGVFKQVCRGLEAAHRAHVVHTDLNPRKILVSGDLRTVKISGFGIGEIDSGAHEQGTLSTSAVSLKALHYMAPEQSAIDGESDERSDVYSAGVLLYEMLTGRVPIGQFNLPSQISDDIPPEFDPIVLKCLETNPAARYPSVGSMVGEIAGLENRLRLGLASDLKGIKDSTSKIIMGSTRPFRKKNVALIGGAVAVVVIGLVATLMLLGGKSEDGQQSAAPVAQSAAPAPQAEPAADGPASAIDDEAALPEGNDEPPVGGEEAVDETPDEATDEPEPEPAAEPQPVEPAAQEAASPPAPRPATPAPSRGSFEDLRVIAEKVEAGLYGPALADLEEFINQNDGSPLVIDARMLEARVYERDGKEEEAKAAYVEIMSRHGDNSAAAEAAYRLGTLYLAGGVREGLAPAREAFSRAADDHPSSSWAPLALAAKADAERSARLMATDPDLGVRAPASIATWKALVDAYPQHSKSEEAWWYLADAYKELKEFELAVAAYEGLMRHFPQTRFDGWWEAGQLLDKKLDREAEAVAAYRQVSESSRNYRDAQRRIARLE